MVSRNETPPPEGIPRYVSRVEATSVVGRSRQRIEHLLAHGRFPPPAVIGVGAVGAQPDHIAPWTAQGWLLDELTAWRGNVDAIPDREPVTLWTVYRVIEYYGIGNNSAYWMKRRRWPIPSGVIGRHVQHPRYLFDPDEVHRAGIEEGFLDEHGQPVGDRRRRRAS